MGVIDFDDVEPADLHETLTCINQQKLAYLFYTTWSHLPTNSTVRARVVIPFDKPITAARWELVWPGYLDQVIPETILPKLLRKDVKGKSRIDHMISNVAGIYFGPYVSIETPLETCTFFHLPGKPIQSEALQRRTVNVAPLLPDTVPQTLVPRDVIARLARTLSRSSSPTNCEMGIRLRQVVEGEPFAQHHERDNVIYHLSLVLANKLPHANPRSVADHFAPSLQLMALAHPECPTVSDVEYKIDRAQAKTREVRAQKTQQLVVDTTVRIRNGWRLMGEYDRSNPYTQQELESFADQEGCSLSDFNTRWLIRRHNGFYIWSNGKYTGPYVAQQDAPLAVDQLLAPADHLQLYSVRQGVATPISLDALARRYGTIARYTTIDMCAQRTYYDDATAEIVEAPYPLRTDIQPEYNAQVDHWLCLLAGFKTTLLKNWIADIPNLQHPAAAMFLFGAPGSGKTFLAIGLSRMFNKAGPTSMHEMMSSFNDAILKNPIAFADESLPVDWHGKVRTEELRQMIQAYEQPLKRKFLPVATLKGSPRFYLAANSEAMLTQSGELTGHDIAAIAERFLLVRVSDDAARYLVSVKHNHWIEHDTMVKHLLWLHQNHNWTPVGRFRHQDNSGYLQTVLMVRSGVRFAVCMFLVRYLQKPNLIDISNRGDGILIRHGKLFVQPRTVCEKWMTYIPLERIPEASKVSKALRGLSKRKLQIQVNRRRGTYQQVSTSALIAWALDNDEMDAHGIERALKRNTKTEETPNP